jgi:hypothetical protein
MCFGISNPKYETNLTMLGIGFFVGSHTTLTYFMMMESVMA